MHQGGADTKPTNVTHYISAVMLCKLTFKFTSNFFFLDRLCKILLKIIAYPKSTLGMNCGGKNLLANLDFRPTIIADKFNSDSLIKMKAMYWKKLHPLHKKKALKLTR